LAEQAGANAQFSTPLKRKACRGGFYLKVSSPSQSAASAPSAGESPKPSTAVSRVAFGRRLGPRHRQGEAGNERVLAAGARSSLEGSRRRRRRGRRRRTGSRLARLAEPALRAGRQLIVISVGALLQAGDLIELARRHRAQIIVPSGALLGLDAVTCCRGGQDQPGAHDFAQAGQSASRRPRISSPRASTSPI